MPKKIPTSSFRNDQGFTMMELMIAMAIFAIGFLAVAGMQLSVVNNNKTGNTYTQALALANAKMEELKNGNIHDSSGPLNPPGYKNDDGVTLTEATKLDENGNPPKVENGRVISDAIYQRSWTISEYKDISASAAGDKVEEARLVTVRVSFPFALRAEKEVSVTSVITGGGL